LNLGNPTEFRIIELAELVIELVNSKSTIERRPLPEDDPKQRQPDISEARRILGWNPPTSLRQGLSRTIGYFETLLREGRA
jgi:UDP-glucuronate decarboxylase